MTNETREPVYVIAYQDSLGGLGGCGQRALYQRSNKDVKALLDTFRPICGVVLLEATGAWKSAVPCTGKGMTVVVNQAGASGIRQIDGNYLAKTDGIDARILSHFARTLHGSEEV